MYISGIDLFILNNKFYLTNLLFESKLDVTVVEKIWYIDRLK